MPKKGKNGREIGIAKKYAKKTCFITYFYFSDTQRVRVYFDKNTKNK